MVRKKQKLFRFSVDTFISMIERITKTKFNYKCNDTDISSFDKFINNFNNVGEEFIIRYLEYQMQSWFNDGTDVDYSKSIRLSWVFGEKAIKRWHKFSPEVNAKIVRVCLKSEVKIRLNKSGNRLTELLNTVRDSEEKMKAKYLNKQKGFAWCIANTSLYFHKSPNCAICDSKIECKEVLKNEFKNVYKIRGYDK